MDGGERWRILRSHVEDVIPLAALAQETGIGLLTLQCRHQSSPRVGHAITIGYDPRDVSEIRVCDREPFT